MREGGHILTAGRFEPDLVIFDCDGVLVDSEPISIAVLLDTINGAGGAIDEETAYALFLGKSMATIVEILRIDFGLSITSEHLALMRAELFRRFRRELKAIRGVREALAGIGLRRCVASSGQPERIRLALGVTGLLELFEPHIYSATMVDRGKPAPDLFLHAAAEMRASPDRCLVIEDSVHGVEAARRAGMACVVVGALAADPALDTLLAATPGPGCLRTASLSAMTWTQLGELAAVAPV